MLSSGAVSVFVPEYVSVLMCECVSVCAVVFVCPCAELEFPNDAASVTVCVCKCVSVRVIL